MVLCTEIDCLNNVQHTTYAMQFATKSPLPFPTTLPFVIALWIAPPVFLCTNLNAHKSTTIEYVAGGVQVLIAVFFDSRSWCLHVLSC